MQNPKAVLQIRSVTSRAFEVLLAASPLGTKEHLARVAPSLPALVVRGGVSLGCMASFSGSFLTTSLSPDAAASLRCVGHRPSAAPATRKRSDAVADPSSRCFRSASSLPRLLTGRARSAAVSVGVWRHSSTFGDFIEVVPTHTAASGFLFWVFLFGSLWTKPMQ